MPNSLVWIGLVVVWIFVLFPMVTGRRSPVRRTGDAALTTRVLHRGGMAGPGWRGPAAGHAGDPDWKPSETHERARRDRIEDLHVRRAEAHMDSSATGSVGGRAADDGVLEAEIVDDDGRDDERPGPIRGSTAERRADDAEETEEADVVDESHVTGEAPRAGGDSAAPDGPAAPDGRAAGGREREAAVEYADGAGDEQSSAAHRPGRGGFDPEADAAASAVRYRTRQRAVLSLGGGVVVTALFAVIFTSAFWWATLACLASLALYLTYLRRQVRLEQQIRRRRMARLQRSRKQADAEQRTRETVPSAPRRESVVVLEGDDEDPAFDHLPPYESAADTEAPPEGLRRASGQ